ncbi:hypothetical protein ABGT23_14090 [Enterobacter cloacae]|uniref:hypothetical protein n=1 Tax=Enterobacter cloacae TaxID=550 RepID=UPI00345CE285
MEVEGTGRQSLKSLPTSLTDYDVRAEAEAQDMIYGFIAFNIIYIMRTKVDSGRIQHSVAVIKAAGIWIYILGPSEVA